MQSAKHFKVVLYSLGTMYVECIGHRSYFRQTRYYRFSDTIQTL